MKNFLRRQKYILVQLGFQSILLYIYDKQKNYEITISIFTFNTYMVRHHIIYTLE
jgi:hypothetical protein